jgi:dolichol-phosphate mannosyltransferase
LATLAQVRTLIILPTYQEAGNLAEVLTRVREAVPDADVLVVDDASPDGTSDMAEKMAAELGNIEILRRNAKTGLGSAYRAGFAWAAERGYEALVEMDADMSHDPADLPRLLAGSEDGADLVIGSRYVPGGKVLAWTSWRRGLSRWGNRYAAVMLDLGVKDATSGFRVFKSAAVARLDLDAVRARGYGFQIEMVRLVAQDGGTLLELPITFNDRRTGQSKMSFGIAVEAWALVTWWGISDRSTRYRHSNSGRRTGPPNQGGPRS